MKTNPATWTTLVTGGCGYLGRQLCLRLLALGHNVWVIDDLSFGLHPDVWLKDAISARRAEGGRITYGVGQKTGQDAPTLTFLHNDLTTLLAEGPAGAAVASGTLWPASFAAVFHLASTEGDPVRLAKDPMRVALKVAIDGRFFAWAQGRKSLIERLVYVSPKDIHEPQQVLTLAADAGERLALLFARQGGVPTACVRLGNLYGKDQAAAHVVPGIAHRVLRAQGELRLPDSLSQARDFLHVDDAVAALLAASEQASDGQPITLGSGELTAPHEVARLMAQLRERPLTVAAPAPLAPGDRAHTAGQDAARGRATVAFAPKVALSTALAQVLRTAERREQRMAQAAHPSLS